MDSENTHSHLVKLRSNEKRFQFTRPSHAESQESLAQYASRAKEARKNIKELRDKVVELKNDAPELVTVVAYGSQVKGKAKLEGESYKPSDFDGVIILDADKLPAEFTWAKDEIESRQAGDNGYFSIDAPNEIANHYRELFKNKAGNLFPDYDIQKVLIINQNILAKAVASIIDEDSPGSPRSEQFASSLIPLFGLSLHHDINTYRNIVFEEIIAQTQEKNTYKEQNKETWGIGDSTHEMYTKGKPVSPDRYWQDVAAALKSWDTDSRSGKITAMPEGSYPNTIAEARKLFT